MSKKYEIKKLSENDYPRWKTLLEHSAHTTIYSYPEYLDILCASTGGSYHIAGVFSGSELLGGVPVYEENLSGGLSMSNRLLLYFNGPVLTNFDSSYPSQNTSKETAVLSAIAQYLTEKNYDRTILHGRNLYDIRAFITEGWSARPSYTYLVDLTDIDECYGRIEQNLRRLIKRCDKSGFTLSDDDDFDSFFDQHLEIHQRKKAALYLEKEPFEKYYSALKTASLARLFHVRDENGQSVASQLVLTGYNGDSYTVCAAAKEEYLKEGTTPFLRWRVFEILSKENYLFNDLTDAAPNSVTRFKSQLGGDLVMNMVVQKADSPKMMGTYQNSPGLLSIPKRIIKKVIGR